MQSRIEHGVVSFPDGLGTRLRLSTGELLSIVQHHYKVTIVSHRWNQNVSATMDQGGDTPIDAVVRAATGIICES